MAKKSEQLELPDLIDTVSKDAKLEIVDISRGKYASQTFSTGVLSLDLILGGGWGIGRWQTIFGPSQSGKSTLMYTTQALLQRAGIPIVMYDHEGSLDPVYCREMGLKLQRSAGYWSVPSDLGEMTYRHIRRILKRMPDVDRKELTMPTIVFFIDSLKAMVAEALDEDDEKNPMGMRARMHSLYIPLVRGLIRRKGAAIITTNQVSMSPMQYGNPEIEPGGEAVKFYPDIRMRLGKHSPPKDWPGVSGGKVFGNSIKAGGVYKEDSIYPGGGHDKFTHSVASTVKNRQFSPYQQTELRVNLGRGLCPIADAYGFLQQTGQMETHRGQKYELNVDGWKEKNGKKLEWYDFGRVVASPKFRDHLRGQIRDSTAFDLFFQVTVGRTDTKLRKKGRDPLAIYEENEKKGKKKKK